MRHVVFRISLFFVLLFNTSCRHDSQLLVGMQIDADGRIFAALNTTQEKGMSLLVYSNTLMTSMSLIYSKSDHVYQLYPHYKEDQLLYNEKKLFRDGCFYKYRISGARIVKEGVFYLFKGKFYINEWGYKSYFSHEEEKKIGIIP